MLQRLKSPEPFGKAGLTVAIVALVLATTGAAFAAGGLSGKQKKEVEKIAKKFQGSGPQGPAGSNGTAGTNGKDGVQGPQGEKGATGAAGTAGQNVTSSQLAPGEGGCAEGGTELTSASGTEVICNGEEGPQGAQGPQGEPWTAGGTLPSGKTETGTWGALGAFDGGGNAAIIPISFPIPLASVIPLANVHFIPANVGAATGTGDTEAGFSKTIKNLVTESGEFKKEQEISGAGIPSGTVIKKVTGGETELILSKEMTATATGVSLTAGQPSTAGCTGGTAAEPKANPGNLCFYASAAGTFGPGALRGYFDPSAFLTQGIAKSGTDLILEYLNETALTTGTWAVTAP